MIYSKGFLYTFIEWSIEVYIVETILRHYDVTTNLIEIPMLGLYRELVREVILIFTGVLQVYFLVSTTPVVVWISFLPLLYHLFL